jgi:hypothetical protein
MFVGNQFKISPVFGSFVILFLLALIIFCAKGALTAYMVKEHGTNVDGQALSIRHVTGKGRGFGNYVLNYNFNYGGVTYNSECQVAASWALNASLPSAVQIRFLPKNPSVNWPLNVGATDRFSTSILLACIFLVLAILLGIKIVRDARDISFGSQA